MVDELLRAKVQQFYELVALSPRLFIFFGKMTAGKQNGNMAGGVSGNTKRLHPHSDGDLYYGDCVRLVHEVMH